MTPQGVARPGDAGLGSPWSGEAALGPVMHCPAWPGEAGRGEARAPLGSQRSRPGLAWRGLAVHGTPGLTSARRGGSELGRARRDLARVPALRSGRGLAERGWAYPGRARFGSAWPGLGVAARGSTRRGCAWHGSAWHGKGLHAAWPGGAWSGTARRGEAWRCAARHSKGLRDEH